MAPILINRAPWNALIDDSGQNLDGTPWTKAQIKAVLLDPIDVALADVDDGTTKDAAQDALITANANGLASHGAVWTPFNSSWVGADGIGPTLGNGLCAGRYIVIGHTCHFVLTLKIGSTTTIGSSTLWAFGLPFATAGGISPFAFIAAFLNSGGGALAPGVGIAYSNAQIYVATSAAGIVSPNIPFTWAANCQLFVRGTYEI